MYKRGMNMAFGDLIKHWRDIRRFSQLALSVESGMSSRFWKQVGLGLVAEAY